MSNLITCNGGLISIENVDDFRQTIENLKFTLVVMTPCSTIFLDNKILIIISIPLLDQSDVYEIYHAHNLPLPLQRHGTNNDVYDIVAQYQIEANTLIAINKERTKCVLLTSDETLQCKNPVTGFCSIKSPIYSVNTNKFCITALFMKNAELIGPFCQA
jgi:hypothetical protein